MAKRKTGKMTKQDKPQAKLPMTPEIAEAFDKGICLRVIMGYPGFSGTVDPEQFEIGEVDPDMLHFKKDTLDCPAYSALKRFHGEIRTYLKLRSMPIKTRLFRGTYFISLKIAEEVFKQMDVFVNIHNTKLVPALIDEYEDGKQDAKKRLGPDLYDESDYPSATALKRACHIQWYPLATQADGKLKDIDTKLFNEAQQRLQQTYNEAALEMRAALRTQLYQLTEHLRERLSGKSADGKPKVLRGEAIEHINEYLEFFNPKDVTNDKELAAHVEKMRKLMSGVEIEELRKDDKYRAELAKSLGGVVSELDKLVTTGGRKIRVRGAA